jgi:hypothetical protein
MPETINGEIERTGNEQQCRFEALSWCSSYPNRAVSRSRGRQVVFVRRKRGESLRPATAAAAAAAAPLVRLLRNDELRQGTTPPKQMTMREQV